jgi:Holliday junction resolvase RusA-like endonuclease
MHLAIFFDINMMKSLFYFIRKKLIMELNIVINNDVLIKYLDYYFDKYPRRNKKPIEKSIPPSLNTWMTMPRFQMNAQKQAWKEFGAWLVGYYGLENKKIEKCNIVIEYFFDSKRRHDADNYTPKNLFDSFTVSGLLVDDDLDHVESLTIKGNYSKDNPRTEIRIIY